MHGPPCSWLLSELPESESSGRSTVHQWESIYSPPLFVAVNSTSVLHAHADAAFLIPTGGRESGQVHQKKKQEEEEEENPVHPLSVTTMISFCPVAKTGVKPFFSID